MLRPLIAVLLLAVAAAPVPPALRIVPGSQIGRLRLGMSTAEAVRVLGQPGERRQEQQVWLAWPREGLGAWFRPSGAVTIKLWGNTAYRTAEGLGIGAEREDVLATYGPSYQAEEDAYSLIVTYRRGIAFGFDKRVGSAVTAILVFRPR